MAVAVDADTAVARIEELTAGMQRERIAERAKPEREHGTPRRKDIYQSGYIAGLCAALSILTNEPALYIEARIVAEVGTP